MSLQVISIDAQNTQEDNEIKVSLRMIGHQVLLNSMDSTSRVLPVIKENNRYRIQFESEFDFRPDELVSVVDSVIKKTKMASSYILEVENCETEDIVYSFKIDDLEKSDIIPCKARVQPKACYNLLFTLVDTKATTTSQINYILFGILIILLASILFYVWQRKKKSKIDPNWIK